MPQNDGGRSLAFVYAQALFDVAFEAGQVVEVEVELLSLRDAINKDQKVRSFLETPTMPFEAKQRVLGAALTNFSRLLVNFLYLVVKNQRVGAFDHIVDVFHELANAKAGIAEFDVASAAPLEPDELENLKVVLGRQTGMAVALRATVAPGLLGGLVLKHGDKRWDASLVHSLGQMIERIESAKVTA